MLAQSQLTAFNEGNSFISYSSSLDKLIAGNSTGVIKIFNLEDRELEPTSYDCNPNLTSLTSFDSKILVTNVKGQLEIIDVQESADNASNEVIYESELPLRDAIFTHDGTIIVCGGDDNKLVFIDATSFQIIHKLSIPDSAVNLSYNQIGQLLSVSLSNGDIQILNVSSEVPNLVQTIPKKLSSKIHTSTDTIDFVDEHSHELVSTNCKWSSDGEYLFIPTSEKLIVVDRSDFETSVHELSRPEESYGGIVDYYLSEKDHVIVLYDDFHLAVFDTNSGSLIETHELSGFSDQKKGISLALNKAQLYIGSTKGTIGILPLKLKPSKNKFVADEAEESSEDETSEIDNLFGDSDNETNLNGGNPHAEDSMVIDQEDDLDYDEDPMRFYNKPVDDILGQQRKRHKSGHNKSVSIDGNAVYVNEDIVPYSPGSTPWLEIGSIGKRYLVMNTVGNAWAAKKTSSNEYSKQQTITLEFQDGNVSHNYHFTDPIGFDLCSMNEIGIVLALSGYKDRANKDRGLIYYRTHGSVQDSWERKLPLIDGEYLTSISISKCPTLDSDESIIVVGSNLGYVRFFNIHGLCLNIIKTTPMVATVISSNLCLFAINQISHNVYTYSIIDIGKDYQFIQQDVLLPLKKSKSTLQPLLTGVFHDEFNNPCLVSGNDETLIILSKWRETNNAKWVPILNCKDEVTEHGNNPAKKNWKIWPLSLYNDQLMCYVLKDTQYPGFPLSLPIAIDIELPIKHHSKSKKKADEENSDQKELDFEEVFLRASIMGKLVNDFNQEEEMSESEEAEINNKIKEYSNTFEASLLKLFAKTCTESKLKKAFSIAGLLHSDKALNAASKIAERAQFPNLAKKISLLREQAFIENELEEEEA